MATKKELERLLGTVIDAYANATEHITEDLQPEFEKLAEEGKLSWPDAWRAQPYDQSEAAWRLATWWHGAGTPELIAEVHQALGRSAPDAE